MSYDYDYDKEKEKWQHRKNRQSKIRHLPKQKDGTHISKKDYKRKSKYPKNWEEQED